MKTLQDTVNELSEGYNIQNSIIKSPGKFEGESLATLYYYDCSMNGGDDFFSISDEERVLFEIDSQYNYAVILTDSQGFVSLQYTYSESHAEDIVREWYNDDEEYFDDESLEENESNKCDSCEACMINGVYCHETGCPEAWKTEKISCWECGCDFQPAQKYQKTCDDCMDDIENNESESSDEIE